MTSSGRAETGRYKDVRTEPHVPASSDDGIYLTETLVLFMAADSVARAFSEIT